MKVAQLLAGLRDTGCLVVQGHETIKRLFSGTYNLFYEVGMDWMESCIIKRAKVESKGEEK